MGDARDSGVECVRPGVRTLRVFDFEFGAIVIPNPS